VRRGATVPRSTGAGRGRSRRGPRSSARRLAFPSNRPTFFASSKSVAYSRPVNGVGHRGETARGCRARAAGSLTAAARASAGWDLVQRRRDPVEAGRTWVRVPTVIRTLCNDRGGDALPERDSVCFSGVGRSLETYSVYLLSKSPRCIGSNATSTPCAAAATVAAGDVLVAAVSESAYGR
jgi:hypothetical protein